MKTKHSIQIVLPEVFNGSTAPTDSAEYAVGVISNALSSSAVDVLREVHVGHVRRCLQGKPAGVDFDQSDVEKIVADRAAKLKGIEGFLPSLGAATALGGITMNSALADAVDSGEEMPDEPIEIEYQYGIKWLGKMTTEITIKVTPTKELWEFLQAQKADLES